MKPGLNSKRVRGRGRKPQHMGQGQRTFDSNGPDVKIRGSAAQIYEKYQTLARDANSAGDRIGAENYLQHAEHYYRILLANQGPNGRNGGMGPREGRLGEGENGGSEEESADRLTQPPVYSAVSDEQPSPQNAE